MAFLELPDGVMSYDDEGRGPAVVFLHGWALDRRMWRPQIEALKSRYRLLTLVRRGFGGSTAPADIDGEVTDIFCLLDHLSLGDCAVVGMSQGGRAALRFAHRHPDRLWALALAGAPLDGHLPFEEAVPVVAYRAMASAGDLESVRRAWRDHPLMRTADPDPLIEGMLSSYGGRDLLQGRASPEPDLAARLDEINVPTLAITGEHDGDWRRGVSDVLAQGLPRGERANVPGAGHLVSLSHANIFNAVLGDFLDRHAPD